MELHELMKSPSDLLTELRSTFSEDTTIKTARNVIKAHLCCGIPLSHYEPDNLVKKNQSLDRFLQDKGSGHEEYKDLYDKVKEDGTVILGIPEWSIKLKCEAERRMNLAEKYNWSLYTCQSLHKRDQALKNKPDQSIKEKHDGIINWVRITLDEDAKTHRKRNIETPIGWVRASDHLVFSKNELRNYAFMDHYPNGIEAPGVPPELPPFERVDLITPARYHGFRFAPLAIYIGYEKEDSTTPLFYALTAGNALGESKVLFVSTDINKETLMECGYKPTPFSNPENFYQFKVIFDKMNPIQISINVFTEEELKNNKPYHFNIDLVLEEMAVNGPNNDDTKENRRIRAAKIASFDNFIPPIYQLLSAFIRILQLKSRGVPMSETPSIVMEIARLKRKRTKVASSRPLRKAEVKRLDKKIKKLEAERKGKLK